MTTIRIADGPTTIAFEFDDLVRYHGTRSICGLTVAFKVMETAWDAVWKDTPPARDVIKVASGFPGSGTRDGFEMVTRAVSRDVYEILADVKPSALIAEAAKGVYFFRLSDDRKIIELGLKPGMVPDDFILRRRKLAHGKVSDAEAAEFKALQFAFSNQLRELAPAKAVNIIDIRPHPQ